MEIMDASPAKVSEFINQWPVFSNDRTNPSWMKPEDLEAMRDELLVRQLGLLEEASPFYRDLFASEKLDIRKIKGIRDLPAIPPTLPEDYLRKPLDFMLQPHRPMSEDLTYEITYTTGAATRSPVPFFNTAYDMMGISLQMRRTAEIAWITPRDTLFNLFPFTGMPHIGFNRTMQMASALGSKLVNSITGRDVPGFPVHRSMDEAILLAEQQEVTVLSGIGSMERHFILRAQYLRACLGGIRTVLAMGEAVPERMRREMRTRLADLGSENVSINNGYSFTECQGTFVECCEFGGNHNPSPDLYYLEVLDPKSYKPLGEAELGLLAITHLNRRGTVLLRYIVGDLVALERGSCPHCGRVGERIVVKVGSSYATRASDALYVEGQMVNPEVLHSLLMSIPGIQQYRLEVEKRDPGDEFSPDLLTIRLATVAGARDRVSGEINERLAQEAGINARIEFVDSPDLYDPSMILKDTRIVDHRQ
jgi:phenylacetate-CoA ligase